MTRSLKIPPLIFGMLCAPLAAQQSPQPPAYDTADQKWTQHLKDLRTAANRQWKSGDLREAAEAYEKILHSSEAQHTPDPFLQIDLYAAGTLMIELDRVSEAKNYLQRALQMFERNNEAFASGETYVALGRASQIQGDYTSAERNFKRGIELLAKSVGPNDLRTRRAWSDLSWLYGTWGKMDESNEALRKAHGLTTDEKPGGPQQIAFLDAQAALLARSGRIAEAQRTWKQAIEMSHRVAGPDSAEFDYLLMHLGQTYALVGDRQSATELFNRFLKIERRFVGKESVAQGVVLGEMAKLELSEGHYGEAESLLRKAVLMMQHSPERSPVAYSQVLQYLGDYYMSQHQWADAEAQYRQALELRQKSLGAVPSVADSMAALSRALEKLHRKDEAKKYEAEMKGILSSDYNPAYSGQTVDVTSFQRKPR